MSTNNKKNTQIMIQKLKISNSCGGKGCYIKNRILPTDGMFEPVYSGMHERGNDIFKMVSIPSKAVRKAA